MNKTAKILIPILILVVFLNIQNFAFSKDENEQIKEINKEIQLKKDEIKKIRAKQEKYLQELKQTQSQKASLANQLAILDNHLVKIELDIESVGAKIDITELEIKKNQTEVEEIKRKIADEKEHLSSILRLIHKQDRVGMLEIILLNNNLSEFLNQVKYLENINAEVGNSLDELKTYKAESEKKLSSLAERKQALNALKSELNDRKVKLEEEQNTKIFILEQTRSNEKEYQRLIQLAKQEQAETSAEIAQREKMLRAKIAKMEGKKLEFNDNGFIWPVPKNTITSYFHDPDYPFRYVFEHAAIDIRAAQGTPVKAAASGYVARVKNGGKRGVSYITIVHGDDLSTVYFHLSKLLVKEDEYVVQGQTIGLSGGLPGTPGAGRFTTGPHLHFGVRLKGIPVNPLEYLP